MCIDRSLPGTAPGIHTESGASVRQHPHWECSTLQGKAGFLSLYSAVQLGNIDEQCHDAKSAWQTTYCSFICFVGHMCSFSLPHLQS
jgi:hypothetical protein